MATFLIAWPNKSWSVYVAAADTTLEDVWDAIDASADPSLASIFRVRKEGWDFYADLPEDRDGSLPLTHWGNLVPMQLKAPYDTAWAEYVDAITIPGDEL